MKPLNTQIKSSDPKNDVFGFRIPYVTPLDPQMTSLDTQIYFFKPQYDVLEPKK